MKTLVTIPSLQAEGGVVNYYAVLRKYLPASIEYFTVGKRDKREGAISSLYHLLKDGRAMKRTLRRHEYHIVHLNPSLQYKAILRDGFFLDTAKRQGRKVIVFFRGWHRDFERILCDWGLPLFKRVYFKADAMIVLAHEFEAKLCAWGYGGPIYVETTTVDDELLKISGPSAGANTDNLTGILFMARVIRSKGIYEALDAYDLVKKRCGRVRFTIAGDGEDLQAVRRYVTERSIGGVEFTGYVRDEQKVRVLETHDIFLLPTYHGEGMPNAVLEAMAVGLPIVTRSVGGLRDFFEQGKMGFTTDETSPAVFADYLQKLVRDQELRRSIGQFNRTYAKSRFVASSVAKRLEAIYQRVIQSA